MCPHEFFFNLGPGGGERVRPEGRRPYPQHTAQQQDGVTGGSTVSGDELIDLLRMVEDLNKAVDLQTKAMDRLI